jgi:hypothetical protein
MFSDTIWEAAVTDIIKRNLVVQKLQTCLFAKQTEIGYSVSVGMA